MRHKLKLAHGDKVELFLTVVMTHAVLKLKSLPMYRKHLTRLALGNEANLALRGVRLRKDKIHAAVL